MHILWTLFIGLIIGVLAKLMTPGRDPGGFFITICIGIAGSLIATFLGRAVGLYGSDSSAGFFASLMEQFYCWSSTTLSAHVRWSNPREHRGAQTELGEAMNAYMEKRHEGV
jgi:uncharacterized membrane protein YeaQ/YmgE (transglycosylase-associated protein family)